MKVTRSHDLPTRPPALAEDAHKGNAGRVLCLAGSKEMPGAALLCASAALGGGAGLVTLSCLTQTLLVAAPIRQPELILWDLSGQDAERKLAQEICERGFDVVLVGPGLGVKDSVGHLLEAVLQHWDRALVLDADALNLLAMDTSLQALLKQRSAPVVITPHPGEASRLLGRRFGSSKTERLAAAHELTRLLDCVTVLKGAGTRVVEPAGKREWINRSGNPGMATAGSGDVLAGLIAALLVHATSHGDAWEAARQAVYWHGLAGDRAARQLGQRSLVASSIQKELGPAFLEGPWG